MRSDAFWTPPFAILVELLQLKGILRQNRKPMGKDRILLVDDDPDNRAMIGHFLVSWGYEVDHAENGRIALEKVQTRPPTLVLLDLEMPEMDGFETCERLKTDPETEWIPVVIFTGLEKMPHRVRGFRHGADDYVVKTAEPDELRARIELVLQRTKRYASLAAGPSLVDEPDPRPGEPSPPSEELAVSVLLARIPFPEAMRLVLAHGKNGVVQLADAERQGTVHVHEGEIVHATLDAVEGEEAFYELALWKSGRFDFQDRDPGPARTISHSARSLLTEASRRHDAWSLISTKVPSFDLVPKWVPLAGAASIRLTRSDWAVIRLVDGRRSIREIVELLKTDMFEAGRVVYNLITIGVLRLDESGDTRDEALDLVPLRGDVLQVTEPFELTALEWRLLSQADGSKSLGTIGELLEITAPELIKLVRGLKERGFVKLRGGERPRRKRA